MLNRAASKVDISLLSNHPNASADSIMARGASPLMRERRVNVRYYALLNLKYQGTMAVKTASSQTD